MDKKLLQAAIDSIRVLSAETVEKAKSGHPGTPLGAAPIAATLYGECLKHNPADPSFFDRDRFILSAGHASSMLYTALHVSGYDITKGDLSSFRQLRSKLPGHPEYGATPGVETSTGPLGQGVANAVGFALAEKILASKFNKPGLPLVDHYTYAFCGDGCMMEGLEYEAAALAGVWKLGKLIVIYDKNDITIEGRISDTTAENVAERHKAQGWQVLEVDDGNDTDAIKAAIEFAKTDKDRPSLVVVRTVIGYGSSKADSAACHGAPLGEEAIASLKNALGWKEQPFTAKKEVAAFKAEVCARGAAAQADWNKTVRAYKNAYPDEYKEFSAWTKCKLPDFAADEDFLKNIPTGDDATRNHSGKLLNYLAGRLSNLVGGSADLGPSNMTIMKDRAYFSVAEPTGTNVHFGVREQAMAAICNGLYLHGGFLPYCSTFFVFADYLKGSVRMSALMDIPVLYVLSHDSIGVGEDGPTHQPVEQLVMLRSVPNLRVWRPCDGTETAAAYASHFRLRHPSAIVTSRQKLKAVSGSSVSNALKGAYVIADSEKQTPDVLLMGSGSEVGLLIAAREALKEKGIDARVISVPCMEEFDAQSAAYRESVMPNACRARVAVEAGSSYSWGKYVGLDGLTVCKDDFGESAPASVLFEINRFTANDVVAAALKSIKKAGRS